MARVTVTGGNRFVGAWCVEQWQSVDALTAATRLAPTSAAAQYSLGSAYERNGDTATALAAYKRAIELGPKMFERTGQRLCHLYR